MMLFSTGLGWSMLGSLSRNPGCCWAGLPALDRRAGDRTAARLVCRLWIWHSSAKKKKKKKVGRRELRLWPLRCLSQFLAERKDGLLRERMFFRTFHLWGGLVFIVYIIPN